MPQRQTVFLCSVAMKLIVHHYNIKLANSVELVSSVCD